MKLDDFFKFLAKLPVDDYVVRLKLKYDHEKYYRYTNELLLYDGSDYQWDNDWNEGQQDVQVIGYISISNINSFYILIDNKDNPHICGKCRHLIFKNHAQMIGKCSITGFDHNFEDICDHEEEMS